MTYEAADSDLLDFSEHMGEAFAPFATDVPATKASHDDLPMSREQEAFLVYLRRRLGQVHESTALTFGQAKRRIAELLDELER